MNLEIDSFTRKVDFIEIGVSDFDVEARKLKGCCGISVEPVREYFDKLPNDPKIKKVMAVISDRIGEAEILYIPESVIRKYGLPDYLKGCNSVGGPHPTAESTCKKLGIDFTQIVQKDVVPCMTLFQLVAESGIDGMYYLKVDTEGHDCVILSKYFNDVSFNRLNHLLPHVLRFESNELTDPDAVKSLINVLENIGYQAVSRGGDTIAELDITKLKNKKGFTTPMFGYWIPGNPPGYNRRNLPHDNTLEAAREFCVKNGYSGVTFQDGVYEVRSGNRVRKFDSKEANLCSWVYM